MLQGTPGLVATAAVAALPVHRTLREPQMRVLVGGGDSVVLRADRRSLLQVQGLGKGVIKLSRLTLRRHRGRLLVEAPELASQLSAPRSGLVVRSSDPRGIWLGQHRYGGDLHLTLREGRIEVVNHLGVEAYLASVVGSEMPQDWPLAALQAQAVAARTYALRQRGRAGAFDVSATVTNQVYQGLASATPRTRLAVESTRSLVLVHRGKLINAVFHSSSGGATEPSGEVWRFQLPYLVSVRDHDQGSPAHRWTQRFDAQTLRAAFAETRGLQSLDVLESSSTGRLRSVRVRGPAGHLVISGRELRRRLGLKSTMVRFNWLTDTEAASTRSGDHALIGFRRETSAWGAAASAPFSMPPPPPPPMPAGMPVLEVQGRGYGHGVGMSQWGARGLAEQGADFRRILEHYYRGVTIRPYLPGDDPAMASHPQPRPA